MANNTKSINTAIFKFLKSRGLRPVSLNSDGKKIPLPADADVFRFKIKNDIDGDADSGFGSSIVSVSVDEDGILKIYYDSDAIENPSFTKLLGQLKQIANRRQLDFDPVPDDSEDELKHDMAKRKEMNKNKLSEGSKSVPADKTKQKTAGLDLNALRTAAKTATPASSLPKKGVAEGKIVEGYYPSGRLASYSDAVPTIKIVLQHTRAIAEGEARYRNISKIFLENEIGERIACPTNRPGIARA